MRRRYRRLFAAAALLSPPQLRPSVLLLLLLPLPSLAFSTARVNSNCHKLAQSESESFSMATETYEELRRKKAEENKRMLEKVKLRQQLSLSLPRDRAAAAAAAPPPPPASPKPNLAKKARRTEPADGEVSFKEVIPEVVQRPIKIPKQRDLSGRVYASDEARSYAIKRAEELEAKLGSAYPSFIKPMLQSHTTGGFWLGLPIKFCNKHLPTCDSTIVLVDEDGNASNTTYLALKRGLSAGWRGFSINHKLVDGDALIFHLIKPTTFKVYVIRCRSYDRS